VKLLRAAKIHQGQEQENRGASFPGECRLYFRELIQIVKVLLVKQLSRRELRVSYMELASCRPPLIQPCSSSSGSRAPLSTNKIS
ncbi:hypothetical protein GOP47_0028581, partial [Adiantum capillus-veneris]